MRKLAVILLLLIAVGFQATAQVDYSFGNIKKSRKLKNIPYVGIKGGLTFYDMHFSDKSYNKLPGEMVMNPGFGVFMEVPFSKPRGLAVGAEFMMIERGMKKSFNHLGIQEVNLINSKYVDLRVPITYYLLISDYFNPYIFAAADIAYCYGGTDKVEFPNKEYKNSSVDISESDAVLNQFDISVIAGVGFRFNIIFETFTMPIKIDASYNFGLLNVKSNVEGTPKNIYAYYYPEDKDKWFNRGVEIMLSIGIPLKFNKMRDSCWGW